MTSALLVISGSSCLLLFTFLMRLLMPRAGKPTSPWVASDFRAQAAAMGLLVLLVAGLLLLAKGFL
ncbi:MAG TPA: hypothetical protein VM489_10405 [Burkholderiales bacterium]|jgi:hypothetical protein|nr:hypothetical protein [Burkholderiales bacterium]